ncbi:phosphoribosyltransferase family protein [Cupriavidus sp. H18C1]|uniref:phosphoribosyltransferase family protein n=1 Tax=Cupriavidus sp. H18C1 TaxID=3241601 RepID=UPI003BB880D1
MPCACVLCGQVQADVVCAGCADDLLKPTPRCPRCALPHRAAGLCNMCRCAPPPFDATIALGDYAPPREALVLALKFGGVLPLANWLARELASAWTAGPSPSSTDPDGKPCLVVPIPLAPARLAERGFNQSWEIARRLAPRLGAAARADLLVRARGTAPQTALAAERRHLNIAGAFALARHADADDVRGRHVALVDDVMTTGATLAEAAAVLKRHGAARVTALVALRTPAPQ